jgi:uncharacterized protein
LFLSRRIGYGLGMRFSEADDSDGHLIDAYGTEGIVIGGRRFARGLIVTPSRIVEDWGPSDPAALRVEHLEALLELAPNAQVLVVGTGERQVFPNPALYVAVIQRGIGIEVMDTGAACRTYNILVSEGRRVVAGLMPWQSASSPSG